MRALPCLRNETQAQARDRNTAALLVLFGCFRACMWYFYSRVYARTRYTARVRACDAKRTEYVNGPSSPSPANKLTGRSPMGMGSSRPLFLLALQPQYSSFVQAAVSVQGSNRGLMLVASLYRGLIHGTILNVLQCNTLTLHPSSLSPRASLVRSFVRSFVMSFFLMSDRSFVRRAVANTVKEVRL